MATVSSRFIFALTVAMLTSSFISGCNSVIPLKPEAKWEADSIDAIAGNHVPIAASAEATLPRQEYDSAGEKIAYIPQPNPYLSESQSIPAEARSIFGAASIELQNGNLNAATAKFIMLTEKYPSLSGPWVKLGDIAEAKGKYPDAIEYYETAISVNRNNVNAYMALGLTQRKQGNFSEAFNTYIDALKVWKDFPEAHLNLAILYDLYLNNAEEAQKHYEAYYFLTGEKDKKVHKWLVEVRHRTGIDQSYIDIPPANVARTASEQPNGSMAVAATNGKK
jgi:tetratricopeptide (TPR) repeat protein